MATFTATDVHFTYNTVDLSAHVQSLTLSWVEDDVEDSAMADTSRSYISGLEGFDIAVTFNADEAASQVSATLWAAKGAARAFVIRPKSDAVSTSNPEYTGSAKLSNVDWLAGSVGDLATNPVSFKGTTALARATA